MNIKESGRWQWGKNATKSKGSICCCSKEEWYHSWPFTTQDFKDVFIIFLWKIFMYLIFTVWLNRETFLPSKLLQTTIVYINPKCSMYFKNKFHLPYPRVHNHISLNLLNWPSFRIQYV